MSGQLLVPIPFHPLPSILRVGVVCADLCWDGEVGASVRSVQPHQIISHNVLRITGKMGEELTNVVFSPLIRIKKLR